MMSKEMRLALAEVFGGAADQIGVHKAVVGDAENLCRALDEAIGSGKLHDADQIERYEEILLDYATGMESVARRIRVAIGAYSLAAGTVPTGTAQLDDEKSEDAK